MTQDGHDESGVSVELLGWPEEKPRLRLDHREFAYAGKFVTGRTGKAVVRAAEAQSGPSGSDADEVGDDEGVLAAVAFDADRTDPDCLVLRYVTVRRDRRGEGLGPRLVGALLCRVREERRFERARIAVNNPFAYEALYRAGFVFTGEETGIAELVLERPIEGPAAGGPEDYRAGLRRFAERDQSAEERAFVEERLAGEPPTVSQDDGTIDGR